MSQRSRRVSDLIRQELSTILLREVRDPRVRLATVTEVDVSPDLNRAIVRVSVLGEDPAREDCVLALERAAGFVRNRLAHRLRDMRRVPALTFELDRGPEHSQRISTLLENLSDDPPA